jgi:hypothetical protein
MPLREKLAEIEATNARARKQQTIELPVSRIAVTTEGEGRLRRASVSIRYRFG